MIEGTMKLYHGTNYSSAMNICQNGIDLSCSELYLDFGPGFYTTPSYEHASKTAIRKTDKYNKIYNKNEEPFIVEMNFNMNSIKMVTKSYPRHNQEWGDFVLYNRLLPEILEKYNITEHNQDKRYDLVYGELADGSIINLAFRVNYSNLSPYNIDYTKMLKRNGDVYGHQYSFHTITSLSCLNDITCGTIKNKEKYIRKINERRNG